MTKVRMNDFASEPEQLVRSQLRACERVLRSGWWILGNEVASFEAEWAQWLGAPHAISCANGLDAIEIGLRAMGIGHGDEVITTPMTAFATVLGILRAGATPVLADIELEGAMLDPESVERCMSPRTKAVVLVHLYGQVGPVEELTMFAESNGIALVEDCAQAHGARVEGKAAGSFGAFAAWSFYPTKNLGAIGDGGALTSQSATLAEAARSLRNYGQTVRYHHPLLGMNSRLDEMQAAILRTRMSYLDEWTARRRAIAHAYSQGISNPKVRLMRLPRERGRHVHHLFVVRSPDRVALQQHLKANGIESLIHYPIPIHAQEPCRSLARDPQGLDRAETHAKLCLSLPCHPAMGDNDVEAVIAAVNSFST